MTLALTPHIVADATRLNIWATLLTSTVSQTEPRLEARSRCGDANGLEPCSGLGRSQYLLSMRFETYRVLRFLHRAL